jgi:MFS family permease
LAAICIGSSNALAAAGAAHLLFRFSPPQHRNLIFSIKQTGVPLGWAIVALVAPTLSLSFGWRVSLLLVLAYAVVTALLLERWRRFWDDDRDPLRAGNTNLLTGVFVKDESETNVDEIVMAIDDAREEAIRRELARAAAMEPEGE